MKPKIRFDIVTLFPETFSSALNVSILKKAIIAGNVEIVLHDIRQYSEGNRRTVDDIPYGGGAGMVMMAGPVVGAVNAVPAVGEKRVRILLTPQGEPFSQKQAERLAGFDQIVMICGHYEGVDQRASDMVVDEELSVGDYVLTGGELPAMTVCDAVSRLVGGVLGNSESHIDESFSKERLEYPQYTRPAEYKGKKVPDVLLSGNHKLINEWRERESYAKTKRTRPDLIK